MGRYFVVNIKFKKRKISIDDLKEDPEPPIEV